MKDCLRLASLGLFLGVVVGGCSGDSVSPLPQDSGIGEDSKVVDHDLSLKQDGSARDVMGREISSGDVTFVVDATLPADLVRVPDGSCERGAFIACQGTTLIRCNNHGKPEGISCSPGECSAVHQRCDECTSRGKSACVDADSVACSDDGFIIGTTTCKAGCDVATGYCKGCTPKTLYRDVDGDGVGASTSPVVACTAPAGYVVEKGDCDDADADVHPGQTAYFLTPSKGEKSFDYDCDGHVSKRWPSKIKCSQSCSGEGWVGAAPACGKKDLWGKCVGIFSICRVVPTEDREQTCH